MSELARSYERILAEPVGFLEARTDDLVRKWVELYLSTFGRRSFFSPERVRKIFQELAELFLACLREASFDRYFRELKRRGRLYAGWGVPFEEVVLSLKLFEEAYLSILLREREALECSIEEIVLAFEELGNVSSSVFAVSYFQNVKREWQSAAKGYQEESERLRKELRTLHEDFFDATRKELVSMGLLVAGINRKLRRTVVQSRRVQTFGELLDREPDLKGVLRLGERFMKQLLPRGSEVLFGLFDENQKKLMLYTRAGMEPEEGSAPPAVEEIFFSQLAPECQEALYSDARPHAVYPDRKRLPRFLESVEGFGGFEEVLFLPLRKYQEALGFWVLGSPEKEVFSKASFKYYHRLARVLANALFAQLYYARARRHSAFIAAMDELDERLQQRNGLESTVDFCLGSMIELLGVERASLMLLDPEKKALHLYAAKGHKVYPFSGLALKMGEGVAGWSVKESRIIAIPRMKNDRGRGFLAHLPRLPGQPAFDQVRSLLCVPLAHLNDPIGVVNLSTLTYHKNFEPSEIEMIHQFARRISTALTSLATVRDAEGFIGPPARGA